MVKQVQRNEVLGFSRGLVTELNPLNSQPDTTSAESNFEIHFDGTRSRRLGLDMESRGVLHATPRDWASLAESSINTYYWEGVAGNQENSLVVFQIQDTIYLYQIAGGVFGETILRATINLGFTPPSDSISFTSVEGLLIIASGSDSLHCISYSELTEAFTLKEFRIKIRDTFGLEETQDPNFETNPAYRGYLTGQHYYNLYNQSWAYPRRPWDASQTDPLDAVLLGAQQSIANRFAPSNSDMVWSGMDRKPLSETSNESFDAFNYAQYAGLIGSTSKAAKGFFIIDALDRGRTRLEAWNAHKALYPMCGTLIPVIPAPADKTLGGPTSVATHAGRVFYSGIKGQVSSGDGRSPNLSNYVFFTQLVSGFTDLGKCYQEGDPTSREEADVVDTDGGFFSVSGAVNIHTMFSVGDRLILVAENGVWGVVGGSGYGFSATNYKVEKYSTYGGVPGHSFIEYGGSGYFWGWDGIYVIKKDQFGDYQVTSLSSGLIDTFYQNLGDEARRSCYGFVDRVRRVIRWCYVIGDRFNGGITHELVFDLKYQAMVHMEHAPSQGGEAVLFSGIPHGELSKRVFETDVYVGDSECFAGDLAIQAHNSQQKELDSNAKFISLYRVDGKANIVFTEYTNLNFQDWAFTGNPKDAAAFMETNAFTGGDFSIKKQVPYLVMAFAETEKYVNGDMVDTESSCLGRFKWDLTHMARSGKWGSLQQLYRKRRFYMHNVDIDNGYSINVSKTKIRGSGRAFSLRIETEPKKDCHIFGWNLSLTGNGVV